MFFVIAIIVLLSSASAASAGAIAIGLIAGVVGSTGLATVLFYGGMAAVAFGGTYLRRHLRNSRKD